MSCTTIIMVKTLLHVLMVNMNMSVMPLIMVKSPLPVLIRKLVVSGGEVR